MASHLPGLNLYSDVRVQGHPFTHDAGAILGLATQQAPVP